MASQPCLYHLTQGRILRPNEHARAFSRNSSVGAGGIDVIEVADAARREKSGDQQQIPSHQYKPIRYDGSESRQAQEWMVHGVAIKSVHLNAKKNKTVY